MGSLKDRVAEIRSKIKDKKSKQGGGGGDGKAYEKFYLSEKVPERQVRVLPEPDMEQMFLIECVIWDIPGQDRGLIDPASIGMSDVSPMRKRYDELKQDDDPSVKAFIKRYFKPKTRWFMRVFPRTIDQETKSITEPEIPNPYWYLAPMDIADEILKLLDDPEYEDLIINPYKGLDFTFIREGSGLSTSYSAQVKRKETPLFSNKDKIDKFLGDMVPLQEKLESLTKPVEELAAMVENMSMDPDAKAPTKSNDRPASKPSASSSASKPSSSALRDRMRGRASRPVEDGEDVPF